MPRLSVTTESAGKTAHELTEPLVTVGRAPDNVIHLDDPSVSGRHAQLELIEDTYHLIDNGSTNGTRVNGETVTTVRLRLGDKIRFGKVEARFESDSAGDAQPLPEVTEVEAKPAESSARPVDFANASPFPNRKKNRDPIRNAIFAGAALAILAFFASIVALLLLHAPEF